MRDIIINKVRCALDAVHSELNETKAGRKTWTGLILQRLCEVSKDPALGGLLCCPDKEDLNPAWLYDMTWYRMDGECLSETPLVLESEWDVRMKSVRYDLEKLLVARADVKVMIVDACCGEIERVMADEIKAYSHHSAEERYLIAKWTITGFEYVGFDGLGNMTTVPDHECAEGV